MITDHILDHKTLLNKFLKPETIPCLFLDNYGIKLGMTNRKVTGKSQNTWRSNNTPLNNTWIDEEIQREILKFL